MSHLFLIMTGVSGCFLLTWILLPRTFRYLPLDRGRAYAVGSDVSKGKPTGAGLVFISICIGVSCLVVPFQAPLLRILLLTFLAMLSGYFDDNSRHPWKARTKGSIDLILAALASWILLSETGAILWLPFTKTTYSVPPALFFLMSTVLIWIAINATNCSDGVDGLSGTMVLFALLGIGTFLYLIMGHTIIAHYLVVPYNPNAAQWAILIFTFIGGIGGYLWHNAYPSEVLMGDAGSRALGFFLGVSIVYTGNPSVMLMACSVLFINGGTGLVKLALLKFFRIRIFRSIRFPLHDHVRHAWNWSNTQVLVRFALVQVLLTIILFGIVIKIR